MANNVKRSVHRAMDKSLIKTIFDTMDKDKDGYLDYSETKAAMRAIGLPVEKSFVVAAMRMYNVRENNESITFRDFYYLVKEELNKSGPVNTLKYVFRCFTADFRGERITLQDLQRINKKLDYNLTKEEMTHMIDDFDLNQDGSVDQSEFIHIITGLEQ